jgi:hypothetical protein
MTLTISLWNLNNEHQEIRVFAFEDAPEFRTMGGQADLRGHEVLELLERAGATPEDGRQLLEQVLRTNRVQRRQFVLTDDQVAHVRRFAPDLIQN